MYVETKNMQENGVDCKSTGAYFYKLQNCMVPIKQNPYKLVCFHQFPFPCYITFFTGV